MLTLYHHPRTRSSRFIFLLEELGAPYEIHRIANIRRPDGTGGVDPENPHPHGKSPALKDGDMLVWESSAIALYLTDKFTQNGIGPVVGDPKRGAYVSLAGLLCRGDGAGLDERLHEMGNPARHRRLGQDRRSDGASSTPPWKKAPISWATNSAPWTS